MIATKQRFMCTKEINGRLAGMYVYEFFGLSTDVKPTSGVLEGSTFLEEDTSKVAVMKADGNWAYL